MTIRHRLHPTRAASIMVLILAASPVKGQAQAQAGVDSTSQAGLGVIEVIGTRLRLQDEVRVEVLDAEDIERHQRTDLSEALDLLPGVTTQNVGGRSERLVFVRGFNSRQVPLFVDGIPVYVPYDGNIDLSRVLVADIAQVVVSKGMTSVLYGPNALGGSINVITRRPTEEFEGRVRAGVDIDSELDHSGTRADFSLGGAREKWYAQLSGAWRERDYFRLPDDFEPTAVQPAGKRVNSASDDNSINLRVGFTPRGDDEYAISVIRQRGEKETPPYAGTAPGVRARFWQWPVYDKDSLYFLSRSALGEDVTLRLRAYQDKFDNTLKSYDDATFTTQDRPFAFTSVYDDQTQGFGADAEWRATEGHVLRGALSYKNDEHVESDDIDEPREKFEDEVWSFAAEYQYAFGANTPLIGGLSYNRQEGLRADEKLPDGTIVPFETGTTDAVNGQVVLAHVLDNGLRTFGGIARKTRFPTIKDRYTSRFGSALPNPDLDAETSDNYELGIERSDGSATWKAVAFYSRLEDAIENVSLPNTACTSPPCSQLQNIARQRNQGIELSAQLEFGDQWTVAGNYTWLDRENTSDPDLLLLDTPEHSALLWGEWRPTTELRLLASAEYNSSRNSTTDGSRTTDSFTIFSLRGGWVFDSGFEIEAGVENIADELYAYEEGFYEPGRRYNVGLAYRF